MAPFPTVRLKKHKPAVQTTLRVYCCCRLPYVLEYLNPQNIPEDETVDMIHSIVFVNAGTIMIM